MKHEIQSNENHKAAEPDFRHKVETYHIPRWSELPDFELYMDQILGFII